MVRLFNLQMFLLRNRVYKLLFLFFVFTKIANCQIEVDDSFLLYNDKALNVDEKTSQNAELLVKHLIKGKSGDKEKFDILFKWVSLNIRYSHSEFYEPIDYNPQSISRILRTKHTICLGYAQLMDTLCKLAELKNLTITGYGKGEIFDIGDSVYFSNHAWNAVNIDGLWYLYDLTWSLRQADYKLTKWGERVVRFLEKHPEKFKRKKIRTSRRKNYRNDCGKEYKKQKNYYYKSKSFPRFMRRIVLRIPYNTHRYYYKGASTNFYLSEPNVFATTHIADNPIWNFSPKKTIKEFENDSTYYFLSDSLLKHQNRYGFECKDCDENFNLSNKDRLILLNKNSQIFNHKNKFIKQICEESLAKTYFNEYSNSLDSIQKKSNLDSSLIYIERCILSNLEGKKAFSVFISLQKNKNNKKKKLLIDENKVHLYFVKNRVRQTLKSLREIKEIGNKSTSFTTVYINKAKQIDNFNTNVNPNIINSYSDKRIDKIEQLTKIKKDSLDELNLIITQKQMLFDTILTHLSLNIWQQAFQHDSVIIPFEKRIKLRYQLKDNYKMQVVDIGKKIMEEEIQYANSVKLILYKPTQECIDNFNKIIYLLKVKSTIQNDVLNNMHELAKGKKISEDDVIEFKNSQVTEWVKDICWLNFNKPKLKTANWGYDLLSQKEKNLIYIIKRENFVERNRHRIINGYLKNGFRVGNRSISDVKRRLNIKRKQIKKLYKLE
jgi:hypothetical protein